jgi:hypothetical protein
MQFVGQWAPLVGAGLVFVAAVVGRYWPEFVKLWRAYQQRRIRVRSCNMSENVSDSIKYVWRDRQNVVARGAWGQGVGFTFLQGSDTD